MITKPYAIAATALFFVGILSGVYYKGYTAGYDKSMTKMTKKINEQNLLHATKLRDKIALMDRSAAQEREQARMLRNELEKTRRMVSAADIHNAGKNSEATCSGLGAEWVRVYNTIAGDPPGSGREVIKKRDLPTP